MWSCLFYKKVREYNNGGHFVFQAEDGIRDADVTGVRTCALPILRYTIVVCAGAGESASMQYIAPYAGAARGEYFKIGRVSCRARV